MQDRPIYCGNFDYDATAREVEKLFEKFGDVERVDMKTGFAFIYMRDQRDAEDAVRALDRKAWGDRRRRLRVEFARGDGNVRRREEMRKREAEQKPTSCLFVVNFDPQRCTERDLERHFEPYGKLERVQIRRNFAFVQYETVEQATEALNNVNKSRLLGRVISCEYVVNTEGRSGGRNGGREMSRSRSRSRSPFGRDRPRSHSISPVPVGGAYSSGYRPFVSRLVIPHLA